MIGPGLLLCWVAGLGEELSDASSPVLPSPSSDSETRETEGGQKNEPQQRGGRKGRAVVRCSGQAPRQTANEASEQLSPLTEGRRAVGSALRDESGSSKVIFCE